MITIFVEKLLHLWIKSHTYLWGLSQWISSHFIWCFAILFSRPHIFVHRFLWCSVCPVWFQSSFLHINEIFSPPLHESLQFHQLSLPQAPSQSAANFSAFHLALYRFVSTDLSSSIPIFLHLLSPFNGFLSQSALAGFHRSVFRIHFGTQLRR